MNNKIHYYNVIFYLLYYYIIIFLDVTGYIFLAHSFFLNLQNCIYSQFTIVCKKKRDRQKDTTGRGNKGSAHSNTAVVKIQQRRKPLQTQSSLS